MKKLAFFLMLCLNCSIIYPQNTATSSFSKQQVLAGLKLDDKCLYIFCRGTRTKSALIAKYFNLKDTNATHVGIGFVRNGDIQILNVTNGELINGKAIRLDSMASFIMSNDVYYLGVWKINVSVPEYHKALRFINNEKEKNIQFDYQFSIDNGDTLYCSELCVALLKFLNKKKFAFAPVRKELNNSVIENLLDRKVLYYFPVDFFVKNKNFAFISSYLFL